jgi:hypothetical protein
MLTFATNARQTCEDLARRTLEMLRQTREEQFQPPAPFGAPSPDITIQPAPLDAIDADPDHLPLPSFLEAGA